MTDNNRPQSDLGELAEEAMRDKREEVGEEAEVRELWDVPTEPAGTLADQQAEDD